MWAGGGGGACTSHKKHAPFRHQKNKSGCNKQQTHTHTPNTIVSPPSRQAGRPAPTQRLQQVVDRARGFGQAAAHSILDVDRKRGQHKVEKGVKGLECGRARREGGVREKDSEGETTTAPTHTTTTTTSHHSPHASAPATHARPPGRWCALQPTRLSVRPPPTCAPTWRSGGGRGDGRGRRRSRRWGASCGWRLRRTGDARGPRIAGNENNSRVTLRLTTARRVVFLRAAPLSSPTAAPSRVASHPHTRCWCVARPPPLPILGRQQLAAACGSRPHHHTRPTPHAPPSPPPRQAARSSAAVRVPTGAAGK